MDGRTVLGTESPGPYSTDGPGVRKLAEQVARRIAADILESGWRVGHVFGSEAELRDRYRVSRAVLREAIRLVEHHEMAMMRRGPNGGLVVQAPRAGALTAAMVIYLEHVGTSVEDLLAVRMLLEPLAARLSAEQMNEAGIRRLRETLEAERSQPVETGGSDLLHTAIGELSGNPALQLFVDVLANLTNSYARRPKRTTREDSARVKSDSRRAHHAIADAIIAGDAGRAEQRTVRHLEAMREWLLSTRQKPIVTALRPAVGRAAGTTAGEPAPGSGPLPAKQKLAEVVARRMVGDIAASGAAVGQVVGSEAELLERFGVSRAVFREAVRLLEYHSVARMRRGPGGGLVVAEPDAGASIEATAFYLEYRKIGVEELRPVREVIEIGALELVTARHDDPIVVHRLRAAMDAEKAADPAAIVETARSIHLELAELTENPVITLFLRIITAVWARHASSTDFDAQQTRETADVVAHVHERIIEAVLAGDLPVARHRMRRHLEALTGWWQ